MLPAYHPGYIYRGSKVVAACVGPDRMQDTRVASGSERTRKKALHEDQESCFVAKDDLPAVSRGVSAMSKSTRAQVELEQASEC